MMTSMMASMLASLMADVPVVSVFALAAAIVGRAPAPSAVPPPAPTAASSDALRGALADAESSDPARHQALQKQLQTRAFLETLDSAADYAEAARLGLHVGKVVEVLAKNPAPSAQKAFLGLTTNRVFLAHEDRVDALIRASVNVRPASVAVVRFLDLRSRPEGSSASVTIRALVENGSPPAMALLEKKLIDPAYEDDDKIAWMRSDIVSHRNDLPLLQACGRLLKGKLKKSLRPLLVEVLFDYRPGEWFRPASRISVPRIESALPVARAELRKIADLALKTVTLTPTQRAAVEVRIKEIETLRDQAPR